MFFRIQSLKVYFIKVKKDLRKNARLFFLKVLWTRQNKPIRENETFSIREKESVYSLVISKVSMVHKGVYTFIATNEHGKADCNITLEVLGSVLKSFLLNYYVKLIFSI